MPSSDIWQHSTRAECLQPVNSSLRRLKTGCADSKCIRGLSQALYFLYAFQPFRYSYTNESNAEIQRPARTGSWAWPAAHRTKLRYRSAGLATLLPAIADLLWIPPADTDGNEPRICIKFPESFFSFSCCDISNQESVLSEIGILLISAYSHQQVWWIISRIIT